MHHRNAETQALFFVGRTSCITAAGPTRPNPARRAGFTLIEMLVVVIIIAVLSGMVMGLFKTSSSWAAKAQTSDILGKVRAAIEEFHAEYGAYPPVPTYNNGQPFYYAYPATNGLSPTAAGNMTADAPLFTFGLMSFLVTRYTGHAEYLSAAGADQTVYQALFSSPQWTGYNLGMDDQARDKNAVNRWKTYIADVITTTSDGSPAFTAAGGGNIYRFTNTVITVRDGWNQELHYSSPPPYQSYKLWSDGPPQRDGSHPNPISTGPGL